MKTRRELNRELRRAIWLLVAAVLGVVAIVYSMWLASVDEEWAKATWFAVIGIAGQQNVLRQLDKW